MTVEEEKAAINRISARLKAEMADVLEMQSCHPESFICAPVHTKLDNNI